MSVGLFSTIAHAEKVDIGNYNIYVQESVGTYYTGYNVGSYSFVPNNGNEDTYTKSLDVYYSTNNSLNFTTEYYVASNDNSPLVTGGSNVTMTLQTVPQCVELSYGGVGAQVSTSPVGLSAVIYYTDGSVSYASGNTVKRSGYSSTYDFTLSFNAEKDVLKVGITHNTVVYFSDIPANVRQNTTGAQYKSTLTRIFGEYTGDHTYKLTIEKESKEAGLLAGIIDKLTSGFSALGEKLSSVVNGILELPEKLWNLISDGLKNLFVPSEESMTAYKDKWDELLASRFGAVYQVVNIITDSWGEIMEAEETDTIEFPQATINLSGTPFTFGGYSVKVVPDGFGVLITAIKSIVAIVCTVAFVNGLRKRYEEVMGVEK